MKLNSLQRGAWRETMLRKKFLRPSIPLIPLKPVPMDKESISIQKPWRGMNSPSKLHRCTSIQRATQSFLRDHRGSCIHVSIFRSIASINCWPLNQMSVKCTPVIADDKITHLFISVTKNYHETKYYVFIFQQFTKMFI